MAHTMRPLLDYRKFYYGPPRDLATAYVITCHLPGPTGMGFGLSTSTLLKSSLLSLPPICPLISDLSNGVITQAHNLAWTSRVPTQLLIFHHSHPSASMVIVLEASNYTNPKAVQVFPIKHYRVSLESLCFLIYFQCYLDSL
jgi:hypothetical protein